MEFADALKDKIGVVGGSDRIENGIGGWKRAVVNPNMFSSSTHRFNGEERAWLLCLFSYKYFIFVK